MVVEIGKDCWNMIYEYQYQLEHKDKFSKTLDIIKTKLRRLYIRRIYHGWYLGEKPVEMEDYPLLLKQNDLYDDIINF